MELGRLGETEMMFTLLVSGSLLVWHWGFSRDCSGLATWIPAYFLVALGTLAKGPQAPAYFAASVGLFLLICKRDFSRKLRFVLSWSHLAGILTFLVVWGAWQVPFAMELGYGATRAIYGQDVGFRFVDTRWVTILKHIVEFPLEVFFGCMLPWSLLLLPYLNRGFRRAIGSYGNGSAREHVLFLTCAICVTFPTVWLVPGGHTRYFVPIYPCFAPLIGLVVDRCLAGQTSLLARGDKYWWRLPWELWWRNWLTIWAVVMPIFGVAILAVSLSDSRSGDHASMLGQPLGFAAVYLAATVLLAAVAFRSRRAESQGGRLGGPVAVALFMGLTVVGVFTNSLQRRSENAAERIAAVKSQLPSDARLVSLGYTHHLFAYYYGEPIPMVEIPLAGGSPGPQVEYFCFHHRRIAPAQLGFEYETIALVPCSRFREKETDDAVTVARRRKCD